MAQDTLGRRSRTHPQSTGKAITLQPSDRIWLRKLAEHGPLPSSYLLAFTEHLRKSRKRSLERLTDLFNEDRTPHGGPYLDRPPQQFRTLDSRYNQLVYDLASAGCRALASEGAEAAGVTVSPGPWLHRHMVACVTASIELAAAARPDIAYIPGHEVLRRAEAELRYPVPITHPETGERLVKTLIPDALFGLRYVTPAGDRFRFFVVECDRATEPATSGNWNRKSLQRSLAQYAGYIGDGLYRDHLKLSAPLLVLNVTTDATRLNKMVALTGAESAPAYMLFKVWADFGPIYKPPVPRPDLLERLWERAGSAPFCIALP